MRNVRDMSETLEPFIHKSKRHVHPARQVHDEGMRRLERGHPAEHARGRTRVG